jgi:SSS family solute:Na+ symporter
VKTQAGPVLGGFLTAGILAAIMSSLDSQFLCLGTMFTTDIVEHHFGADHFTDKQKVTIARSFIILIVAVTYALSLLRPASVFALGVWCFSGFSALFPLVIAALYWRRVTKWGAYACVLATAGSWWYFFSQALSRARAADNPGPIRTFSVELLLESGSYETMPVIWVFTCSLVALVLVSLVTRPPKEETVQRFFT